MGRWTMVVAAMGAAALGLGACTADPGQKVATAGGTPTSTATAAPGGDPLAHELRFVACMRQQGIADMPDPVPGDTSGRSAVRYALDVMGKGSDDTFQTALDKCVSLLPPPPPEEPPTTGQLQGYLAFAQCMRRQGIEEFPDPSPDGRPRYIFLVPGPNGTPGTIAEVQNIDGIVALNLSSPAIAAAFEVCKSTLPTEGN